MYFFLFEEPRKIKGASDSAARLSQTMTDLRCPPFCKDFDLKIFLSLELITEIVAIQYKQSNGDLAPMGDFAPDYTALEISNGVLPSGLEFEYKSIDSKGKKGMVIYTGPKNHHALLVAKSALSNHNETELRLFGNTITASCPEMLFNLVSLCYDYQQNKDYPSFKAAVLKLFAATRPFETTKAKKDLKNFPAELWDLNNRDVMMYCFFKRCYDDVKQYNQFHTLGSLVKTGYFTAVEAMPNPWWGCGAEDDLQTFAAKIEAAYTGPTGPTVVEICKRLLVANEGQNRFGQVAERFLAYVSDFSDHTDFCCTFDEMGLDNVFYVLDPSNGGLTPLDDVDEAQVHAAIEPPSTPSEGTLSDGRATPPGRTLSSGRALSEAGRTLSVYPRA